MIKNRNETSAAMDKALKNLEQAKARYEAERKGGQLVQPSGSGMPRRKHIQ